MARIGDYTTTPGLPQCTALEVSTKSRAGWGLITMAFLRDP